MKSSSTIVSLILVVIVLYSIALTTGSNLYSVYYRVIGNGNFYVHVANIDAGSANGTVQMSGGIFNVYASYSGLASAYNTRNGFIYWAYPDPYGRSIVYQINAKSASVAQRDNLPSRAIDLGYNNQDNKVYGMLVPPSSSDNNEILSVNEFKLLKINAATTSFVQMNPANVSEYKVLNPSAPGFTPSFYRGTIDPKSQLYYYASGSAVSSTITSLSLGSGQVNTHPFRDCQISIISLFATTEQDVLIAVSGTNGGNLKLHLLDLKIQKCSALKSGAIEGMYFDSQFDPKTHEAAVLTSSGLFIVNIATGKEYNVKSVMQYNPEYFTALHFVA